MTRIQLAELINVNPQTVGALERADGLRVDVDQFCELDSCHVALGAENTNPVIYRVLR